MYILPPKRFVLLLYRHECKHMCIRNNDTVSVTRTKRYLAPPCNARISYPYRTADGRCNNLNHETWGQAGQPQPRLLPNAYEDGMFHWYIPFYTLSTHSLVLHYVSTVNGFFPIRIRLVVSYCYINMCIQNALKIKCTKVIKIHTNFMYQLPDEHR